MRNALFSYLVRRQIRKNPVIRKTVPLEKARRIVVLFRAAQDPDAIAAQRFAAALRRPDRSVELIAYAESKRTVLPESVSVLRSKDVSWLGIPRGEIAAKVLHQPADILIGAWLGRCLPLSYLAMCSLSTFRLGEYHPEKEGAAEFILQLPEERRQISSFFEEVSHYLQSIRIHEKPRQTV